MSCSSTGQATGVHIPVPGAATAGQSASGCCAGSGPPGAGSGPPVASSRRWQRRRRTSAASTGTGGGAGGGAGSRPVAAVTPPVSLPVSLLSLRWRPAPFVGGAGAGSRMASSGAGSGPGLAAAQAPGQSPLWHRLPSFARASAAPALDIGGVARAGAQLQPPKMEEAHGDVFPRPKSSSSKKETR